MCGQWGERGTFKEIGRKGYRAELTAGDIGSIVEQVAHWKPAVTLFGGEPLVNPGIVDMILLIKRAGLRCNMITNGTLIGKWSEKLVSAGIDEMIISLDGPGEVHDRMRGKRGTFEKVMSGLESLNVTKQRMGSRKPIININATIWEDNAPHLHELMPLANRLGASTVTYHHPIFIGAGDMELHMELMGRLYDVRCSDFQGFVRDKPPRVDADQLIEQKKRIAYLNNGVRTAFYPNFTDDEIRRYYSDLSYTPESYRNKCLSPWMVLYIFPDGDVKPCLSLGVTLGNMFEDPIEDILQGPEAVRFRGDLKKRGRYPACSRCTELYRF
jgi:MoaA/NifB/PqqE/SkfB family radical SAM enzyme